MKRLRNTKTNEVVEVEAKTCHSDSFQGQAVWMDSEGAAYCIVGKESPSYEVLGDQPADSEDDEKVEVKLYDVRREVTHLLRVQQDKIIQKTRVTSIEDEVAINESEAVIEAYDEFIDFVVRSLAPSAETDGLIIIETDLIGDDLISIEATYKYWRGCTEVSLPASFIKALATKYHLNKTSLCADEQELTISIDVAI